jgi:vacuolar-type H+-ATPase subunit H
MAVAVNQDETRDEIHTDPLMPDQDVLRHLLEVEANALVLVNDAQTEADRRVSEAEKRNCVRYEDTYTKEAADLDAKHEREIAAAKEAYNHQLEDYRRELDGMQPDHAAFNLLLERFL